MPSLGRFRINLHRERGRPAAAIRLLPAATPSIGELRLPAGCGRQGSFTLEEHLQRLVAEGIISRDEAMSRAAHPEELDHLLRSGRTS